MASAFADSRRRIGETAHGWRALSAASVTLAVGINVVGHAGSLYLATVFGGLGIFACPGPARPPTAPHAAE